jgi:regulator of sirC expression with transglutaminase-like and TPR domain
MASIENVLAGASAGDYFAAAQFYYQSNGDINKARTYIDKALEMSAENHFILRQRSLILARQGDKKGAIETAKLSIIAAEAAGNTDYVKMNKDSISEWSK